MYNNLMKKKQIKYILLGAIIILGLILRVEGLNKPFGLGYDEAITYVIAIKQFPLGIINYLIKTDVHMPLYFLTLHLWIKLFSNSDIVLRLLSVMFGVFTIFAGYLSGKEILNEKAGLISALLFSINSLVIYYSQEVRFYSLLTLLSTILLLFFIKIIKRPTKKNISFLIFSSLLLIYTNTLAIIFIAVIFLALLFFLFFYHKKELKIFILSIIIGQIFLIPFYFLIYQISINRGTAFPPVLFFDNQVIFAIVQNWFSPILVGLYNNPQNYFTFYFKTISTGSIIFILTPIIIGFTIIFKNNFKKPEIMLIFSTSFIFILIELLESYLNKFTILSRYTLFILPFLIILIATGISNFKNKFISKILLSAFILINLIYLICSLTAAPKMPRISGQKIPAIVLKEYKISKQDIVIYPIRDDLSDKYYKNNFRKLKALQIFSVLYPKDDLSLDAHSYYKNVFKNNKSKTFENYFNNEIYKKMGPNSRLVIVIQNDFMPYDAKTFNYIIEHDNIYRRQPILFMKLFKITCDIINDNKLILKKVYTKENWVIIIYEKEIK